MRGSRNSPNRNPRSVAFDSNTYQVLGMHETGYRIFEELVPGLDYKQ